MSGTAGTWIDQYMGNLFWDWGTVSDVSQVLTAAAYAGDGYAYQDAGNGIISYGEDIASQSIFLDAVATEDVTQYGYNYADSLDNLDLGQEVWLGGEGLRLPGSRQRGILWRCRGCVVYRLAFPMTRCRAAAITMREHVCPWWIIEYDRPGHYRCSNQRARPSNSRTTAMPSIISSLLQHDHRITLRPWLQMTRIPGSYNGIDWYLEYPLIAWNISRFASATCTVSRELVEIIWSSQISHFFLVKIKTR